MKAGQPEVLLAHMGSPWWAKKDAGAWTIPKGEYTDEEPLAAAKREFKEELGHQPPIGDLIELGTIEQNNNKTVVAWALEGEFDVTTARSNTVSIEWPPRSGKMQDFPEIDRAQWFSLAEAAQKLIPAQTEFLERLAEKLGVKFAEAGEMSEPAQASLF